MRKILVIILLVFAAAGSALADKEFTYDKKNNFDGAAVSSISLEMDQGDITVERSRGDNIEVLYKNAVFAKDKSKADDINKEYKYSAKIDGNRLVIEIDTPHDRKGNIVEKIIEGDWDQEGSYPMLKLIIPNGKSMDIVSASADIDISDITADFDIESASSDIILEKTQGKFSCDVASGDIDITGHKGSVFAKGRSSDINITDVEGEVDAASVSGDVVIEQVKGPVRAATTSGDGRLFEIEGDVEVDAVSGDLVGSAISGSLRASSVSGDIRLDGLSSKEGNHDIKSVSGSIQVAVSRDFSGSISIRSMSGSVSSSIDGDITTSSGSRIAGSAGDGKGRLNVSSTSGDITVSEF